MPTPFTANTFTWLAGIEDTCVYPAAGAEMDALDEYRLTEHDENWREDLEAVARLGATGVRYGVKWPVVHTAPGEFDWTWLDERLTYAVKALGLTVVADLVHYGTPTWLPDSFADNGYPGAIAEFAGAFAARYRGLVDHITPLNEPVTTASFCGLRGIWPPALTGWTGWTEVMIGIVTGIRTSIAAVRAANPDAVIVHVEASALYATDDDLLTDHAHHLHSLAELPMDLLSGRVDDSHPLHGWLVKHGAEPAVLEALTRDVPRIDLLGVNYYPDLTPRMLLQVDDAIEQVTVNRGAEGMKDALRRLAGRYGVPVILTETSIEGDEETREQWVRASTRAVEELRDAGMDIRGYTWWPLTDFVDWSYASGGRNVEEFALADARGGDATHASTQYFGDVSAGRTPFLRRMGLLALQETPQGTLVRRPTRAAAAFAERTGKR